MGLADFSVLTESGLLKEVEDIVAAAYLSVHPGASRAEVYEWLRFENPYPVGQLAEGVMKLRKSGASFDAEAVDKACAKASEIGLLN